MVKKIFVVTAVLLALNLTGCTYFQTGKVSADAPTEREQICNQLKRSIIFKSSGAPSIVSVSATQNAENQRLYDKYQCGNLE